MIPAPFLKAIIFRRTIHLLQEQGSSRVAFTDQSSAFGRQSVYLRRFETAHLPDMGDSNLAESPIVPHDEDAAGGTCRIFAHFGEPPVEFVSLGSPCIA
ncbi:hypothetical protein [Methanoculleus sp. UBA303]|uniref:hypothetical protein n=1 Tax=Methanoculleus sp. UBA303 TaxID=1915497 RepID=UPI0025D58C78|nr:hypothetical protein [Methanoculleus sp. UBA303]